MFHTEIVEEIKTHILCLIFFLNKIVPFVSSVAHTHCILDA